MKSFVLVQQINNISNITTNSFLELIFTTFLVDYLIIIILSYKAKF